MYPSRFRQCSALINLAALWMSSVLPSRAQQAASQEPPAVTIRVNTRLVLVDVVVTDKSGKPISGLKAEDFTVQEKGKTQKVAFFNPPREANKNAPPELAPGVYTNKPEFRSPGGPLTVLLIDAVNTPFRDQAYARQQMLKYVKDQLKPGERMGVFALTKSLRVLQDFTSDPQILLTALEKYKPTEPLAQSGGQLALSSGAGSPDLSPGVQVIIANAQREIAGFMNAQVSFVLERRTEVTLAGLRSLARILAGIPGRKNVVWLTATFPFELIPEDRNITAAEEQDLNQGIGQKSLGTIAAGSVAAAQRQSHSEDIRRVAAELSSAQVAIYPVDARGLISGMEFQDEDLALRQPAGVAATGIARISDTSANQQTMRDIADQTGGKAYVNQNEIRFGAAMAAADHAASYTIGYYPEDKKWDGKFRTIKVKVNRDGTEVRNRKGYFAIDPALLKDRKPEQEVAEALGDSAPDTQVTFSAQVKPGEKGKVNVTFLVDPNTISGEDASGGKKVNFILYAAVYSAEGKMIESRSTTVDHTFDVPTFQKILQQGIMVPLELDAQPGKNDLRLAVQDVRTGLVGTINAAMP